jgi:alpha-tubulin suppressor-like RCC1 family protein
MRSLQRASSVVAITAFFLWTGGTALGQVNGNATISAMDSVFGTISVSTSNQFGGAISSIKWRDKEFINNWDHGRQLGENAQFFNRFCCYNPYETGSFEDAKGPTSTSKVLSLTASGNRLEATTQMCWNFKVWNEKPVGADFCGDPSKWLPVTPYTSPLSNYKLHKTVTIGFAGIPNVIEILNELLVPEPVLKGSNNPTAVVNYEFSSLRSWDVVSKDFRNVRALAGVDDRIKVVSTADGNYAMAWYAPELLQPYHADVGVVNWWLVVPPTMGYPDPNDPTKPDPNYACVHFGHANRYDSLDGSLSNPGHSYDRAYLVVGNLDQVKEGLAQVHAQFTALDPEVFNWSDYLAINGLSFLTTPEAAQAHWLTQGLGQGLRGSKTFSASQYLQLNPDVGSAPNYQAAVDHFVKSGRREGRTTVTKPSAGMQHLLAFKNRAVNAAGQNAFGQLGASTSPPLTHISNLDNSVTEIAAGDYTSFAVKNDGTLWVWGSNQYGARGDGTTGGNISSPVQVPMPARITTPSRTGLHAIAVGTACYAAIDTEGQVWTWGANWNGRLGDGIGLSRFTPARVKKSGNPNDYLTGIVTLAIGGGTMAAVDTDGTVWTWGAGANGTLGNGFLDDSGYAVQVLQVGDNNTTTPMVGISQVACGSSGFCIALARYGTVFGWGNNNFSQLGLPAGGALSIATPIGISPRAPLDMIAAGSAHCIAHSQDGLVYGWGYNGRGQLGLGSTNVAQAPPVVMQNGPDGMNDIGELLAAGNCSIMVRYTDGALFVTGDNQSGQLAVPGNPSSVLVPVRSSF